MPSIINGSKIVGGLAPSAESDEGGRVLGEDSYRCLLDVTNRHSTKTLYLNIGEEAEVGKGFAVLPGTSRQLFDAQGSVYVISETGDVEYSIFAGRG